MQSKPPRYPSSTVLFLSPFQPPAINISSIPCVLSAAWLTSAFSRTVWCSLFTSVSTSRDSPICGPYISSTSIVTSVISLMKRGSFSCLLRNLRMGWRVSSSRLWRAARRAERCRRAMRSVMISWEEWFYKDSISMNSCCAAVPCTLPLKGQYRELARTCPASAVSAIDCSLFSYLSCWHPR